MISLLAAAATREVEWKVTTAMLAVLYGSMAAALAVFVYGLWRRVRVWRLGRPEVAWDRPLARLRRVLVRAGAQTALLREPFPGVMHALVFFGFLVLFAATVVVFVHDKLGIRIMQGAFYLGFQCLTVDLLGLFLLVGVGIAVYRRYVLRPVRLERGKHADALLLAALGLIVATGFLLEGMRIEATDDPWANWSPVGAVTGLALHGIFRSDAALATVYPWLWVGHALLWHGFLATIPFSKAIHLVTAPANIFFAKAGPPNSVPAPTDFDAEDVRLGIRTPLDLSWRQLLSLDACTECGRCTAACPAFAAEKPLNPKRVILDLRDHVRGAYAQLRKTKTGGENGLPLLAGGVIAAEALWACTTCRACEEACPVGIEHVPVIVGLRQNLAMEQVAVPARVAETLASLEAREHPFRGAASGRTDWAEGLDVRELSSLAEGADVDVVYWVGCAAAFDERAQQVARSLAKVLRHAGVRFAIFGSEERCTGDVARRTGNEFHYDMLARANVEALNAACVTKLVTHCPHCLQQLRHEYRQFGGRYDVVHHSELVSSLLGEGRLRLAPGSRERVTYHDPCYLGRYNRVFDAPRRVLDVLQVDRVEMERHRRESFCCGAGGGHAFYDDEQGEKVNGIRAREAAATGATTVATGCPFCLTMLEAGIGSVATEERRLRVRDFVELVADALVEEHDHA